MKPYFLALFVVTCVLVVHLIGIESVYYRYPLFDTVPHFLGGVALGFFFYAIIDSFTGRAAIHFKTIIALAIFAGIVWEAFEIYYDISSYVIWSQAYILDTTKDLILDTLGAVMAYIISKRITS